MTNKSNNKKQKQERRKASHNSKAINAALLIKGFGAPVNTLIKWGSIVIIVYIAVEPLSKALLGFAEPLAMVISSFSGKATSFNAEIKYNAGSKWNVYLALVTIFAILVAIGSIIFSYRERHLRKDTVQKLHYRIELLERQLDPSRSTSGLTARGDTHPEDL